MRPVKRRSFWGWGYEGAGPDDAARARLAQSLAERFARADLAPARLPRIEEIALPVPRTRAPAALAAIASDDPWERALHTYGRSYRDAVRAQRRDFAHPPDWVAFPTSEAEVADVLDQLGTISPDGGSFSPGRTPFSECGPRSLSCVAHSPFCDGWGRDLVLFHSRCAP